MLAVPRIRASAPNVWLFSDVGRQRGEVKIHEEPPHGYISQLFPEESYGFISTPDGREIYFHRNSVKNGEFEKLATSTPVRFLEEAGEEGPQATVVMPV